MGLIPRRPLLSQESPGGGKPLRTNGFAPDNEPVMRRILPALLLLFAACGDSTPEEAAQARREADFKASMENVVMEGWFNVLGRGDDSRLREERYEIQGVTKVAGDLWTITARVQYGDHDFTAPFPVKIVWAEDTPVISITDFKLPGMDEGFTARVAFYRDRYSGMWWHGETGGQQFGRLVKQ